MYSKTLASDSTDDDVRAWFDTFTYAYRNLLDISLARDRLRIVKFLKRDFIARKYFHFLDTMFYSEIEETCSKEFRGYGL